MKCVKCGGEAILLPNLLREIVEGFCPKCNFLMTGIEKEWCNSIEACSYLDVTPEGLWKVVNKHKVPFGLFRMNEGSIWFSMQDVVKMKGYIDEWRRGL